MSTARFQLAFDGGDVESGSMDVYDLAPAMLAAGDLIKAANRHLNGDRASVSLRVESDFQTGSFELALILDQALIEKVVSLFSGADGVFSAADLARLIFGVGTATGSTVVGVVKLLRLLNGEKPVSVTVAAGSNSTVIIQTGSGEIIHNVDKTTAELYEDDAVRNGAKKMVQPLKRRGLDYLEVREDGVAVERITKNDVARIASEEQGQQTIESRPGGQADISHRETVLRIVKPSFRRGNKYQVTEGDTEFHVTIEDESFLDDVDSDTVRFAAHGRLRAVLRQEIIPGQKRDSVEHFVEKVLAYETPERPRQLSIGQPIESDQDKSSSTDQT